MKPQQKELRVDDKARGTLAGIIDGLRTTRVDAGLTQDALSEGLPVRGRAISEWENGSAAPTLQHLIQWSRELGLWLELRDRQGEPRRSLLRQRPGESWEVFQRRQLATHLRNRRLTCGMSQTELGEIVGVSRDSIQRWEQVCVPPRPIAHVVWAQAWDYTLALGPISFLGWNRRRPSQASIDNPPVGYPRRRQGTAITAPARPGV